MSVQGLSFLHRGSALDIVHASDCFKVYCAGIALISGSCKKRIFAARYLEDSLLRPSRRKDRNVFANKCMTGRRKTFLIPRYL